jgi:hypothetical protein
LFICYMPITWEAVTDHDCSELLMGQYLCPDPNITTHIDPKTQQLRGCTKDNKARGKCQSNFPGLVTLLPSILVLCIAVDGITCSETKNSSFTKEIPCKWT